MQLYRAIGLRNAFSGMERAAPAVDARALAEVPVTTSYSDALDTAAGVLDRTSESDMAERLRVLASIAELPATARPGADLPDPAIATNLRSFAASIDEGYEHADVLAREALLGEQQGPAVHRLQTDEFARLPNDFHYSPMAVRLQMMRQESREFGAWADAVRGELQGDLALFPGRSPVEPSPSTVPEAPAAYVATGQRGFADDRIEAAYDAAQLRGETFGARSVRDAIRAENVLRRGAYVPEKTSRHVGGRGMNLNGVLPVRTMELSGRTVDVVVKSGNDAPREALAARIARRLGADRLVPAVALAPDGRAHMEFRPGTQALDAGIRTGADLERHVAHGYEREFSASPDLAMTYARRDVQLMRAFDYITANCDRHGGNVLVHDGGRASWIDHGFVGVGTRGQETLRPSGRGLSLAAPRQAVEQLDPGVVEHIRARLTPDMLRADVARLAPDERSIVHGMVQRLEQVLDSGQLTWSARN